MIHLHEVGQYHSLKRTTSVMEHVTRSISGGENAFGKTSGVIATGTGSVQRRREVMEDTNLTNVSEMEQQREKVAELGRKMYGATSSRHQLSTSRPPSLDSGSRAASQERYELERAEMMEELRAERNRMMEEAARTLREAWECAYFTRQQAQQEYETWRR